MFFFGLCSSSVRVSISATVGPNTDTNHRRTCFACFSRVLFLVLLELMIGKLVLPHGFFCYLDLEFRYCYLILAIPSHGSGGDVWKLLIFFDAPSGARHVEALPNLRGAAMILRAEKNSSGLRRDFNRFRYRRRVPVCLGEAKGNVWSAVSIATAFPRETCVAWLSASPPVAVYLVLILDLNRARERGTAHSCYLSRSSKGTSVCLESDWPTRWGTRLLCTRRRAPAYPLNTYCANSPVPPFPQSGSHR